MQASGTGLHVLLPNENSKSAEAGQLLPFHGAPTLTRILPGKRRGSAARLPRHPPLDVLPRKVVTKTRARGNVKRQGSCPKLENLKAVTAVHGAQSGCTTAGGPRGNPDQGGSPVLAMLGGQRPVQLLNDAAGGQWPVDSGEVWRPRGRGKLSSKGRVSALPARGLEECRLAWSTRGTERGVRLWEQGGGTLQKDTMPPPPPPGDPDSLSQKLCQVSCPRSQRQGSPLLGSIHGNPCPQARPGWVGEAPQTSVPISPLQVLGHRKPDAPFLLLGMSYFTGSALLTRLCASGRGLCLPFLLLYPWTWYSMCV